MIWFRRIIAVPLALVFILLFISLLVIHRVNATAGNPDFYADRLEQADVYNYLYQDVLPAALEEIEADVGPDDFPVEFALLKSRAPGVMEQALPAEWLKTQVEMSFSQVVPYVLGDTDNFSVSIPLKDRVAAAAVALKALPHDEEFFNELYQQSIDYAAGKYGEMQADLPEILRLSDEEAASVIRTVLPPEWIHAQIDAALDEVVPYLTGEKEHFVLTLDISERMDALEAAVTDILVRPEAYDYALNDMAVSYIRERIEEIDIPEEIVIYDSDILDVLEEVVTPDWYEAIVNDVVGQVFSYLRGDRDTIDIVIYLGGLKPAVIDSFTELVDQKLEDYYNSLPTGTLEQTADFLLNPPQDSLPEYRPIGFFYWEIKLLAGIDIESMVSSSVNDLPDEYTLSDTDIRESLSEDGEEDLLTQVREMVQEGYTYTDADLREDLGEDFATITDTRVWIASDFSFTEVDLQEWMEEEEGTNGGGTWQTLEDIRSVAGTVRDWIWPAWFVPALLSVGVGFLGGRGWRSRVIWGAAVLAIACLIAYIAFGPVFSAFAEPRIDKALNESLGTTDGLGALAADKGVAVARDTVDSFVGGINIQAIVLLVLSLAAIAVVVWHPWSRRTRAVEEITPPPDLPPADQAQEPPDRPIS